MGAHSIGSARVENSGYKGSWSTSEGVFDNDYYRQMLTRGWGPDRAVEGNKDRNQWKTVDHGPPGIMMLNSDLCLAYDNNSLHQACMEKHNFNNRKCKNLQNKGKPINALETQCCAWTHKGALFNKGVFDIKNGKADLCGKKIPSRGKESRFLEVKNACCVNQSSESTGDCDSSQWPKGQSFPNILTFAANENQWLESFAQAWKIATENSHLDLHTLVEYQGDEDDYECGKLRTRKICQTRSHMCSWYRKSKPDDRGRFRFHCGLESLDVEKHKREEAMRKKKEERDERNRLKKIAKEEKAKKRAEEKAKRQAMMEEKKRKRQEERAQRQAAKAKKNEERKARMNKNKSKKRSGGLMDQKPESP